MKHPSSLYRVGGLALLAGSVLMVTATLVRPSHPETIQAATTAANGAWVLAYWSMAVGVFAMLGGWVALSEHFQHTQVEGWGMVGLAGFTLGSVGMFFVAAFGAEGVPRLANIFLLGGAHEVQADAAFVAANSLMSALERFCWIILWVGVAFSSIAIAEDEEYPRALGYSGILVAAAALASMLFPDDGTAHDLLALIGFVWTGMVGYIFMRIEKAGGQRPVSAPGEFTAASVR